MKTARWTSQCPNCHTQIESGSPIVPLAGDGGRIQWVHADCLPAQYSTKAECPHWIRRGVCHLGPGKCMFTHPKKPALESNTKSIKAGFTKAGRVGVFRRFLVSEFGDLLLRGLVLDVAGGKGELSFELENLHDVPCIVVDPRASLLDSFAERFCRFRARHFFYSGTGSLDTDGMFVTDAVSEGFKNRWRIYEEQHLPGALQRQTNKCGAANSVTELELRWPRHLRLFFDEALVNWTQQRRVLSKLLASGTKSNDLENSDDGGDIHKVKVSEKVPSVGTAEDKFFQQALQRVFKEVLIGESSRKQRYQKLVDGRLELLSPPETKLPPSTTAAIIRSKSSAVAGEFSTTQQQDNRVSECTENTQLWTAESAYSTLVSGASLIVGLHCDGAAEPIVDFALAHNKAFAIVPCCTCSKQFPRRRITKKRRRKQQETDGDSGEVKSLTGDIDEEEEISVLVKSYGDLLEYLEAKDRRIRRTQLDFDGKNICLYFKP